MADGNGGPLSGLGGYLSEIDRLDDELLELRSEYMNKCKGPRGQIGEIKTSASEAGVNMRAFNVLLRDHRAMRAHQRRLDALEPDARAAFDEMEQALGAFKETPLGQAALERVRPTDIDDAFAG